ncbi:hormone-sensitive lipase isoform X2 [Grus americana]|uniref:hormone-sensitive lipase isoform X2 n=1 Tax=Grus americana TaxID=9117 RepID=UPI00240863C3|nr:hormone-sensitive lipase isoform X2 [Grus americana]
MDARPLFQSLQALADDNASFFQRSGTESGRRFAAAFAALREHGRRLEPALRHFARLYHRFDLDEATPGNGYRSLVQTARCCLAHAVHKSRYVAAHRRSVFFRAGHNVAELEAYCAALAQLRALLCLAQRLLAHNRPGCLFPPEDDGLSELVLREYSTMHNGCFYGRCLGFQFAPSIRPFLQTIAIGLVSFGENYRRDDTGLGVAAGSLFTSGKFAIDPELRGDEFERLTQNLDVHFWKSFWNLTETELLAVGVCRALAVPPEPLELPLAADPSVTVTIAPPVAHTGPGPVHMRLLSYHVREGQDSAALSALTRAEGPRAPLLWRRGPPLPPSPALLVHFHGGGFVAQTSRSHEPYLRGWARELGAPILSVDYALAPEAPFPRALEECFYAYCWALRNCRLLGSTAQRVCLAGDSAGGNLCLTVSMRAAAVGVQAPHGIVAAYPVTLVQAAVSPSRLLTLLDPLLPLSVLCKCLSAYAGTEGEPEPPPLEPLGPTRLLRRDTALLLRDLRRGAAAWLGGLFRRAPPHPEPGRKSISEGAGAAQQREEEEEGEEGEAPQDGEGTPEDGGDALEYPDEFQPLRSRGPPARFDLRPAPLARNPYVSPLLAPDGMLGGLPPVHLVACALDPMLDDSVALARRLRALGRPVTLRVVPDLPHGFLSLGPLSPETRQATALCTRLIRDILHPPGAPPDGSRRGSLLLGARRESLAPQDGSRRGSLLLGSRRESLAPHDSPRRGSVLLGARRESLAPHDSPRRGSLLLGARRESLAPQDGSRRGSVLLGGRRESLATHGVGGTASLGSPAAATHGLRAAATHGIGDVGGPGAAPTHGSAAAANPGAGGTATHGDGTALTHGGSSAPVTSSSTALTHSVGAEGGSAAPPHGIGAPSTHGASIAPTDGTSAALTHGIAAAPTHCNDATLTHGIAAALTHGTGAALTHGNDAALTHGTGAALTHGNDATLTHVDGTALTHGTGTAPTCGTGAVLTHGTSNVLTHGTGAALTHGNDTALTHIDGTALTHGTGTALTHGTGVTLTHGTGAALTHGTGTTLTYGTGTALTHGTGTTLTHGTGVTLTHGTGVTLTHGTGAALTHGTGTALTHSTGTALTHGTGTTLTHGTGTTLTHGTGAALTHGTGTALTHGTGAALTHGTGTTLTHGTGTALTHGTGTTLTHGTGAALTHGTGTALTHGTSAALTHGTGVTLTHGTGVALTHGTGTALTHGTAPAHGPTATLPHGAGSSLTPEARAPSRRPSAQPPLCCGALAEGAAPTPPAGPVAPPGQRHSGAQPLPRRPSGPAGREVGS